MYTKICEICGKEFTTRDKRTIVCSDTQCRKEMDRLKYKNRTKTCICKNCGKEYQATNKQSKIYCHECARKDGYNFKTTVEQKIICRQCGKVLYTVKKNKTNDIPEFLPIKTCDECKQLNREKLSYNMRLYNPAYSKSLTEEQYEDKQHKKEEEKKFRRDNYDELVRKPNSKRMRENNPMKNPQYVQKMLKTYKYRKSIGLYKNSYDITKRKNYKGDRGIKNYLRISLKPWRTSNFERTNYTCEICGIRGCRLNVHHTEKFSDIVENFASQLSLDLKTLQHDSEEYNKLEDLVVKYHNENDIGIVVCENCHDKIDENFHKQKKEV